MSAHADACIRVGRPVTAQRWRRHTSVAAARALRPQHRLARATALGARSNLRPYRKYQRWTLWLTGPWLFSKAVGQWIEDPTMKKPAGEVVVLRQCVAGFNRWHPLGQARDCAAGLRPWVLHMFVGSWK